jgi:hypothetical protein
MNGLYVSQECGLRVLLRLYQDQFTVHRARALLDLLPY